MTEVLRYRDHHIQSEVFIKQIRKSENEEELCKEKFGESSRCAVNPVTYRK